MAQCVVVATVLFFSDSGAAAPVPDGSSDSDDSDVGDSGTGTGTAAAASIEAPKVDRKVMGGPEVAEPGVGGRWKPTGLSTRSAFHTPAADRTDPYGPRARGVPQLSLEQVTRFSLENPLVEAAEEEILAMEAMLSKAKFAWIPVVDTVATLSPGANVQCDDLLLDDGTPDGFEFQFCRSGRDRDTDIYTIRGYFSQLAQAGVRFSFQANTVIPVFSFGRKLKHYKNLGRAGVALAKLKKIATEQETILRVRQAHVTLLLARESQSILVEAKKVLDKAYGSVIEDLGDPDDWAADDEDTDDSRDPDDLTKIELAAVELELRMREALKAEALALSALWALAGRAAPEGFDIAERTLVRHEIEGGTKSANDYVEIALTTRPEAKIATAAIEARKAQERLARAAFLPDMGIPVSFGVGLSNAADPDMSQLYYQDGFNYSRFTAALAIQWRWDTGAIFDLRRARAQVRSQEHQRDAQRLLLAIDVQQAYQDLVEAQARVEATERAVELSWKLVLRQQLRDAAGGGDAGELLKALEKWYTKRFDQASAVHAHDEAIARLARAIGRRIATRARATEKPAQTAPAVPDKKK